MSRRRQQWRIGDVFAVENADGQRTIGQIVGQESEVLNSVSCAFFDLRLGKEGNLDTIGDSELDDPFAVLFVTRDLLDNGVWPVIGRRPVRLGRDQLPYEQLRDSGFVGAKVIGTKIVGEFLNAYRGLTPWDDWKDPAYLDGLLVSPEKKPPGIVLKKS
jgi:hypothetical protein